MREKQFLMKYIIKFFIKSGFHILIIFLLFFCLTFIFLGVVRHGRYLSPVNNKEINISHKTNFLNDYASLDEYIEVALDKEKEVWKENKFWVMLNEAEARLVEPKNIDFIFLDINKLIDNNNPALDFLKEKSFFHKKEEIRRMQKLSWAISQDYQLSMPYAEKLVLEGWIAAYKYKISPYLLLALMGVESSYKQFSKSGAGAIGLTQIIPKWHPEHMKEIINRNENIWSIPTNINAGASVLKKYLDNSSGKIDTALQKYNGSLSDPTKKYAKKVLLYKQNFLIKS